MESIDLTDSKSWTERRDPCGIPELMDSFHEIDFMVTQYARLNTNEAEVTGKGLIRMELEPTLVELPYTATIGDERGLKEYRTVLMEEKTGSLAIYLSSQFNLNEVASSVVLATGEQCPNRWHLPATQDHLIFNLTAEKSYNITVPAKDIWHIAFKNNLFFEPNAINLRMEYLAPEQEPKPDTIPKSSSSPSCIPSIVCMIIVGLLSHVVQF